MQRRNWIKIDSTLIQNYSICKINVSLKTLPLDQFLVAACRFCGPIAVLPLEHNSGLQLPQRYNDSIIFFNCLGQLKRIVPFKVNIRVIYFDFITDESLLVVHSSGQYYLINSYSGALKEGSFADLNKSERCFGVAVCRDTLIMHKEKYLGMVSSIKGGAQWETLNSIRINPQNPQFQYVNDHIIYLSRDNTIEQYHLITHQKKTLFSHSYLQINGNNLLSLSFSFSQPHQYLGLVFSQPPNSKLMYYNITDDQLTIHEPMTDLTNRYLSQKSSINHYKNLYEIGWMGHMVVFSNRKMLLLFSSESMKLNWMPHKVVQEVDGLRIYAEEMLMYRVITHAYQELILMESQQEEHQLQQLLLESHSVVRDIYGLHCTYHKYLNKEVITLNELQQYRHNIDHLLAEIVTNAQYCIDMLQQVKLYKFISFLVNYYRVNTLNLNCRCEQLRIINNLKYQYGCRYLTFKQFHYLKQQHRHQFINILLRCNMHYIADLIYGDSESNEKIFLHWCKCKIQKEVESVALEHIHQKYQQKKTHLRVNNTLFTDIAKYCVQWDKIGLALELIEYEKNLFKKTLVSLLLLKDKNINHDNLREHKDQKDDMEQKEHKGNIHHKGSIKSDKQLVEKIMSYAQQCSRQDVLYRVIVQLLMLKWLDNHLWVNILHGKPNLTEHYLRYLKQNNQQTLLKEFYKQNRLYCQLAYEGLNQELKAYHQSASRPQESQLRERIIKDYKKALPNITAGLKRNKKDTTTNLQKMKQLREADRAITAEDVDGFYRDKELEYMAEIVIKKDNNWELALELLSKIKSDHVFVLLQRKAKFKECINLAYYRQNAQVLNELLEKLAVGDLYTLCYDSLQKLNSK